MVLLSLLMLLTHISLVFSISENSINGLDCTRKNANGLYGQGCSSRFMRCYNGKLYIYVCPKKLKFNVETAKCEQKRQVIACINNEPFDCSKKKDGVYGSGKCSTTYYHCSRGHSSEMLCPAGLYYNDKLKSCDEIDSIDECDLLTALRGFDERREGAYIERNLMSIRGGTDLDDQRGYSKNIHRLSLGRAKSRGSGSKGRNNMPKRQNRHSE
ncbi:unnamed protein product [Thelazia callipaeda]|uniref:Chitin-binding type-2 domain-containing protein n=1 Tax=Thelazia callipaeda TaxID=103827 RepID=A0A0N5CZ74_THECL|nr:unnamed protein product [Thelazia callipaeda]